MSGKVRQKNSANTAEGALESPNEKILKECHSLYTDADNGLIHIAESLGVTLLAPRKKIIVLLIGNHSAGKSSFINWYIEEHVQRTGVAIETQGFTFITSGKKRESLTGNATLHLYPHFKSLQEIGGVVDYLGTEISTSRAKRFSLVTFVDTPGLVDGEMQYPFDVNEAVLWLAERADLVFVFFDPIGQALCRRTLNLVEKIAEKHSDHMRFYLSKADEAGTESDRQRVLMQIVQELCRRPSLNRTSLDIPTIFVPSLQAKPSRCLNQIEDVCRDIEKTIHLTMQNTLNSLEKDCDLIASLVARRIEEDSVASKNNLGARLRGSFFVFLAFIMPLITVMAALAGSDYEVTREFVALVPALQSMLTPLGTGWNYLPADFRTYVWAFVGGTALVLLLVAKMKGKTTATLTRKQKRALLDKRDYVETTVKQKKKVLYEEYLRQSVAENDMN